MAEPEQTKTSPVVRAIVDYGGLVAWLGAFLVYWRVMGMDRSEALLEATWWLVGGSAAALATGWIAEKRIAPGPPSFRARRGLTRPAWPSTPSKRPKPTAMMWC